MADVGTLYLEGEYVTVDHGSSGLTSITSAASVVQSPRTSEAVRPGRSGAGGGATVIAKIESGERRVDLVELEAICDALGISLVNFVRRYRQGH